jgi:hypothetical protein
MAIAATQEGIDKLKLTEKYKSYYELASNSKALSSEQANTFALQAAARELHAQHAIDFSTDLIPGLDRYLIEKSNIRNDWGTFIGEVSASHHWSLTTVEQRLGIRGVIPDPINGQMNLAFIACAIRIIDYAHINSDRATFIDRVLRSSMDNNSVVHWKAQEQIIGPSRDNDRLKYITRQPIKDVEAWWLFYEMASGLDKEIISVNEYLTTKNWLDGRFSLEGVTGVKNPLSFSAFVQTSNFEPVDIRFKPDSIERLVDILGGKTLYGNDNLAPLRELIQNSRDAILLRQAYELSTHGEANPGKISISIEIENDIPKLKVVDNGIGMTSSIINNYLLGIASDYWNSQDFYATFANVKDYGFKPTGKFGIGFLSVFMVGDKVEVETQKAGNPYLSLNLQGLGKHGALVKSTTRLNNGTTIKIQISKQDLAVYNNLDLKVRAKAPMLTIPLNVKFGENNNLIENGWWSKVSQDEFFEFIHDWHSLARNRYGSESNREPYAYYRDEQRRQLSDIDRRSKWSNRQPEVISSTYRIIATPGAKKIILCTKGIAVSAIEIPGLTGIAEIEDVTLNAARSSALKWDAEAFRKEILTAIEPKILDSLDSLESEISIPSRFPFISNIGKIYGKKYLTNTKLPWISVIVKPGNTILHSAKDFKDTVKAHNEIIVTYGVQPWAAEQHARNLFPSFDNNALIVPVNSDNQPTPGGYHFNDRKETKISTLPKQFEQRDYPEAVQLLATLKLIAESWNVEYQNLVKLNWYRVERGDLCIQLNILSLQI